MSKNLTIKVNLIDFEFYLDRIITLNIVEVDNHKQIEFCILVDEKEVFRQTIFLLENFAGRNHNFSIENIPCYISIWNSNHLKDIAVIAGQKKIITVCI